MKRFSDDDHRSGLTALELLIALAVAAVIAGMGLPALQNAVLNSRRLAAVNGFTAAIAFARNTAQTRNTTVYLCQPGTAGRCGDISKGRHWVVAVTAAASTSGTVTNPHVLRILDTDFSGAVVSNRPVFEFRPFPLRSTNGTLSFCDPRGGRNERSIVISVSGRPRLDHPSSDRGLSGCATG